jgi:mono/diheme cytochrome c family protein
MEFPGWHDHRGARRPVSDSFGKTLVVAQDSLPDPTLANRDANNAFVTTNPLSLERTFLVRGREMSAIDRGHELFGIHCAVCHGLSGRGGNGKQGHGLVGRRLGVASPNFHFDPKGDEAANRVPNMPDGEYFEVITHGVRTMPAYGARIDAAERWAIVHYVRALQSLTR